MTPILLTDFYKTEHHKMYPQGTTKIYSNLTPRKSRIAGINEVVVFGIQHFIKDYLINKFNDEFFYFSFEEREEAIAEVGKEEFFKLIGNIKESIIAEYKKHIPTDTKHIEALWDLGYLPLKIKALPEGLKN